MLKSLTKIKKKGGLLMLKLLKKMRNKKGFTLVELMVVVVIIGILVAIAIPVYNGTQNNAKKQACFANQRTIEGAAAIAYSESSTYFTLTQLLTAQTISTVVYGPYLTKEPKCPLANATGYVLSTTSTIITGFPTGCNHGHY